ncbi:hypothetical protein [Rhizobium binxianense]|uniref:hypothetical protein n=1 Tax=Rhizobium binxianense TaxID=3024242 RepID=UPI00234F1F19|nr:hypothetical protein [Rhizobium sp. BC56]MDC7745030.1 hypothetical protein [Rhizobium sp. BC56]
MAQALMGGLAIRKQGEMEQAGMAQGLAALTGQPYTPPEKSDGFLSSIFGGNKGNPGATGSSMPKVDASGNVALPSTGGDLPQSFLAAIDKTEGAGDYDTLFGHAQKDGPFAGTAISQMPIRDVLAFTDPSGAYAQFVKGKVGRVATPVGKYQTVGTTLRSAVGALGLDPNAPYDKATQDRVASYLARQRIASADTLPGKIQALRAEWQGFKNVPDSEMAQIVADLQSGAMAPTGTQVASANPATVAPPASPIQPPVIPPPSAPTPGYRDPMVTTAGRPDVPPMPPAASAPGEVASLDPSVGIPMPGAAGQMRASDPAQVMPPRAGQQSALPPLPTSTVGPTPNVASVPSVADPRSQIPPEFQRSPQLMNADPNKGILQAILGGGSPASPEQVAQAQQSGQARLAQALDNAPQQAPNAMANPRVQALVQAISNPNVPPQMKAMAAQQLQVLMKPPEYGFETLPDGTVLRSDPRTGTVAPIYQATPKPVEVNGRLVDPVSGRVIADYSNRQVSTVDGTVIDNTTGQPVYQSHKPMDVNSRLVDPVTGQQIADYSNPNVSEVDGALVDQRTGKVIYQGKPKGMAVQPGETVVNPQTGEVLHQGAGYKPEDVSNLRKEIQNLPSYKSYQQALPSYQSMIDTAKTDSKASDLNLVYGLGKIMDPNSVVREGEMVMVNNTSSLPDWLQGAINSVNGGSRLEPATRTAILNEARSRLVAYRGSLDNDVSQYRGIIGRRGMNEADVLPTLGDIAEVPNLGAPTAGIGPAPEGVPSDVWGAMTPAERKLWQK